MATPTPSSSLHELDRHSIGWMLILGLVAIMALGLLFPLGVF